MAAKIVQPKSMNTWMCSDASGVGYGAYVRNDWICGRWSRNIELDFDRHDHCRPKPDIEIPKNSNVQELFPILESLERWGESWRDHRVFCVTDNTQVVADITTGRSANSTSMELLRRIFWLTVTFNCHLVAEHIPGEKNVVADTLSRFVNPRDLPLRLCCSDRYEVRPGL